MPIELVTQDSYRLTHAAEELIKAAGAQAENTIQKKIFEELREINKATVELTDSIKYFSSLVRSKFDNLNHSIVEQTKHQKLAWAIDNANIDSFDYFEKGDHRLINSTDLVKAILITFRKGYGHYINDCSLTRYDCYNNNNKENEKKFRDDLCDQIHGLLGHRPKITKDKRGFLIWYD